MNPRKNIIRMLLAALVLIVICCILLSLSGCTDITVDTHASATVASTSDTPTL